MSNHARASLQLTWAYDKTGGMLDTKVGESPFLLYFHFQSGLNAIQMWLVKCLSFNKALHLAYKMCMKYLTAPQSGAKAAGAPTSTRDLYGTANTKGLTTTDHNIETRQGHSRGSGNSQV